MTTIVYITNDYKCINTDDYGHLLGASTLVKDDKVRPDLPYEVNGKDLLVDYGVYFRAKSEFIDPGGYPRRRQSPSPWRRWST